MLEIDRFAIASVNALQTEVLAHFDKYEFHPVVAKLQTYCSEDLGGFYLDVLKDRLYTSGVNSPARRSAQTAIWHLTLDAAPAGTGIVFHRRRSLGILCR
jgi:isoleucyl-tRNA synthetase